MSIRVGIEFNDKNLININISEPEKGNPGIGGSEYLFGLLGKYLSINSNEIEVIFLNNSNTVFPENIKVIKFYDSLDMIHQADIHDIDILIHQVSKSKEWYNRLSKTKIKSIPWAHIYLPYQEVQYMKSTDNVKRIVFVGKEEYDNYIDDDIIYKSTYIYNMINTRKSVKERKVCKPIVTYVGSLVPEKGFHLLAKIWPEILKQVHDAELHVIGTGKVYDRNAKLGKYGIAQEDYENSFMPYLTDKVGNILSSVVFHGLIGDEKEEIFSYTSVGIANPTGISETFCLSAVEMELCGVPVVSKKKWGLLDTIVNGETGFLCNQEQEFIVAIVKLLLDVELNKKFGIQAQSFVKETFEANVLIQKWIAVIKEVYNNEPATYYKVTNNLFNDFKIVKCINRVLRMKLKFLPSMLDIRKH